MPETLETAGDIQEIRYRLEGIEATQTLLVRDRRKALLEELVTVFESTRLLPEVYLAVDGKRTQNDLVDALRADGHNVNAVTVHRRIALLRDEGLIDLVPANGRGNVYKKNNKVEQILQLSKKLR